MAQGPNPRLKSTGLAGLAGRIKPRSAAAEVVESRRLERKPHERN